MNSAKWELHRGQIWNDEGKGTAGCLFFFVLLGIAVFVGLRIVPPYFSYASFETDVKTEISRAGAHFFDDETIIKDILDLARRNEIRLTEQNIKIERFAGQVFVTVRYSVPEDLFVYRRNLDFEVKASSYIGKL
jgi:hypothetical protein